MTVSTKPCIRGCSLLRQHLADCDDPDVCRGCLPRRAQHGLLCWPCHRRLELMLTDADTVDRWLTGSMGPKMSNPLDRVRVSGDPEDGDPAPFSVDIMDVRTELRDHWATWVDWLCERHNLTPTRHSVKADADRLLSWIDRLEEWEEIGDLWEHTALLLSRAHALAPWRPAVRRLGSIPCPECGETNLVIYGGESDTTCGSCGLMIPERQYGLWERIVREDPIVARNVAS